MGSHYSTFENVEKSFKQAWKFKILWVFAVFLAAAGFSFNSWGNSSNYRSSTSNLSNIESSASHNYQSTLTLLSTYAPQIAAVVSCLVALVVIGMLTSLVLKSWFSGAMTDAVYSAASKDTYSLSESAQAGIKTFWRLIKLDFLYLFYTIVAVLILGVPATIGFTLASGAGLMWVMVLLMIPLATLFVLLLTGLGLTKNFSKRYVVIKNCGVTEAFKLSLGAVKKHVGKVLALMLVNFLVSLGVLIATFMAVIAMLIPGAILAAVVVGIFSVASTSGAGVVLGFVVAILVMLISVLFVAFVIALQAIGAFVFTYKEFSWTNLYIFIDSEQTV